MIKYKVPIELYVTVETEGEDLACAMQRAILIILRKLAEHDIDSFGIYAPVEVMSGDNAEP